MNDEPVRPIRHRRQLLAAALTFGAAAVIVFACLSGPSAAAPSPDRAVVSGVNDRVPTNLQGTVGGDVGQLWWRAAGTTP